MKPLPFILLVLSASLAACSKPPVPIQKQDAPTPSPTAVQTPPAEPKAEPVATPAPTPQPVATPVPPPPVVRNLAPEGVFFNLEKLSVTTDSGITGFPTGTRLKLIKADAETWRVKTGTYEFDVLPSQLTNDLDLAALAAGNDAKSQQALRQYLLQTKEAADRIAAENTIQAANQVHDGEGSRVIAPGPTRLDPPEKGTRLNPHKYIRRTGRYSSGDKYY